MKTIKKDWDESKVSKKVDKVLANYDDGELFVEEVYSENITFDDNKVKSASFDNEKGFGLRGVNDDNVNFYHSSELDQKNLDKGLLHLSKSGSPKKINLLKQPSHKNIKLYKPENPMISKNLYEKICK